MVSFVASLPSVSDFFPPTPQAFSLLYTLFRSFPLLSLVLWTPLSKSQAMGKTSTDSKLNLPGRYAWAIAEFVGPLNLTFILFVLPSKLYPTLSSPGSLLGTGLPVKNELLGCFYILHYINRAIITPIFLAPSMSPIHAMVTSFMVIFQFINSSNIASWLVYSSELRKATTADKPLALLGLALFFTGLAGNIAAENKLFSLRRGAAKRKAKSEGKVEITYHKVYVIPPAEGFYKYILYPHYGMEWIEWTGYWILGGAFGLGWNTPALWFVIVEICTMLPRAVDGRKWYEQRFGKRAVGGRGGGLPVSWL